MTCVGRGTPPAPDLCVGATTAVCVCPSGFPTSPPFHLQFAKQSRFDRSMFQCFRTVPILVCRKSIVSYISIVLLCCYIIMLCRIRSQRTTTPLGVSRLFGNRLYFFLWVPPSKKKCSCTGG